MEQPDLIAMMAELSLSGMRATLVHGSRRAEIWHPAR